MFSPVQLRSGPNGSRGPLPQLFRAKDAGKEIELAVTPGEPVLIREAVLVADELEVLIVVQNPEVVADLCERPVGVLPDVLPLETQAADRNAILAAALLQVALDDLKELPCRRQIVQQCCPDAVGQQLIGDVVVIEGAL
jgi:hypothetical protein